MHARLPHMVVRGLLLLVAASVFACSVALVWLAASNPLELEVREGSVWIHVLAARAGIDIYDPFQVAFVNMNHGPLDPILKTWISRCLPSLPGHFVTRGFVLLAPLSFLVSAYGMLRKNWTNSLLAAGALHLFLTHTSLLMLVGRSDATALCGLCVAGFLTHQLLESPGRAWFERPYVVRQLGLGALSSAVFLASSRYLPAVAAFQFVVVTARLERSKPTHLPKASMQRLRARSGFALEQLGMATLLYLAGFALVWVPTFLIELGGSFQTYYSRFFGFFSAESGWGTFAGPSFELFPETLLQGRTAPLLAFASLVLLGAYRLRKRRAELAAWLFMLALLWVSLAYGYYKNQAGGGLHYFLEFFVVAWVFVLHSLGKRDRFGGAARVGIFALVVACMPWPSVLDRIEQAFDARARARTFLEQVALRTHGEPIFGEGTHLFKTSYRGEVVDTGDAVHATAMSQYFGKAFTFTYLTYIRELRRAPPRFVMVAVLREQPFRGIMTPTLTTLIQKRYRRVLIARNSAFALGGSQALYELRQVSKTRPNKAR